MTKLNSTRGHVVLAINHMAGMIDLAALPLWIGILMRMYRLTSPQAGLTVTLFLGAIFVASSFFAPRYVQLPHRIVASGGFAVGALAFAATAALPVSAESFPALVGLHILAGLGAGAALSVTHGTIGRTVNPHRLFGFVNVAMGLLAIIMFAVLPAIITASGGPALFAAFALTMGIAALASLLSFPHVTFPPATTAAVAGKVPPAPVSRVAWLVVGVVICLALNQSTVFAFVERLGVHRGFSDGQVQGVLIALGFINLVPGIAAALLQSRLSYITVGVVGPLLQAALAITVTHATSFAVFAVPAAFYVAIVIFTHTFMFGLLSKVDPTGRAVAATPAMMMVGSAIGPVLGGIVVVTFGYEGLGWAVAGTTVVAVTLMVLIRRELGLRGASPAAAAAIIDRPNHSISQYRRAS